jgi:hypothetical protein
MTYTRAHGTNSDAGSHAAAVYGHAEHHAKNAIALQRLRTEFKDKVEVLPFPARVVRELRKLAGDSLREESEKKRDGPEGSRGVHDLPGPGGPVGSRRRRRLSAPRGWATVFMGLPRFRG